MFELYLSQTSAGEHSTDPRNRFHETAIRDAQIATELTQAAPTAVAGKPSLLTRLRLVFAGSPAITTEACNCPA